MQDSTNDSTDQDLQCATVLILSRCFDSQNTLSSYDFSYEIFPNLGEKKNPAHIIFNFELISTALF